MDIKPSPKVNINVKSYTNNNNAKIDKSNFDFKNTNYQGVEETLYTDEQSTTMDSTQYTNDGMARTLVDKLGSMVQGTSDIIQTVNTISNGDSNTSRTPTAGHGGTIPDSSTTSTSSSVQYGGGGGTIPDSSTTHTAGRGGTIEPADNKNSIIGKLSALGQGLAGVTQKVNSIGEAIDGTPTSTDNKTNTIDRREEIAKKEKQKKERQERQKKVEKKIKTLLNSIKDKAVEGSNGKFEHEAKNWCAEYATWAWQNSKIDGVSAYDIAKLNGVTTTSTGEIMMHFYNAKKEGNNNIEFYYNDRLGAFDGKNADKLPEGTNNYTPKPGDYAFFAWTPDYQNGRASEWKPYEGHNPYNGIQDHTALVKDVYTNKKGEVTGIRIIEGNVYDDDPKGFRERDIMFNATGDKYTDGLIGYGTIKDLPDSVNVDD